jgi:hypothetical protein
MNTPPFLNNAVSNTPILLVPDLGSGSVTDGRPGGQQMQSAARMNLVYQNITNPNTAGVFIQYFDAATAAAVTVGTTKPLASFFVPGTGSVGTVGVLSESYEVPRALSFKNGVVVAATTTQQGGAAPASAIQLMAMFG